MEKKRTNSDPFMKSTAKHSIYPFRELFPQDTEKINSLTDEDMLNYIAGEVLKEKQ
jgi:hypothetical protein